MSTKPIKVERKTKVLNHKSHTWANIQKWFFLRKVFCLLFLVFFLYLQIHNFEIAEEEKVFQYNRKHTNVVWMLKPGDQKFFVFVCFMILFSIYVMKRFDIFNDYKKLLLGCSRGWGETFFSLFELVNVFSFVGPFFFLSCRTRLRMQKISSFILLLF